MGRPKPAPKPYRAVAAASAVPLRDVLLGAAHSSGMSGALAAGYRAAFVTLPGAVPRPVGPQPDIVGPDLTDMVRQIITSNTAGAGSLTVLTLCVRRQHC